ncbi:MAG: YggT family protein [Candidatus Brocadiia bacterium]
MGLLLAAIRLYMLVIVARALFSWAPPRWRMNELYRFLRAITEPVLEPVRRALPTAGGIDFSPLVVIIALEVLSRLLHRAV